MERIELKRRQYSPVSLRCRISSTNRLSSAEVINPGSLKRASLYRPITVAAAPARCGLQHYSILPMVPTDPCTHSPIFMGPGKSSSSCTPSVLGTPRRGPAAQGPSPPAAASPLTHAAVAVADVSSELPGLPQPGRLRGSGRAAMSEAGSERHENPAPARHGGPASPHRSRPPQAQSRDSPPPSATPHSRPVAGATSGSRGVPIPIQPIPSRLGGCSHHLVGVREGEKGRGSRESGQRRGGQGRDLARLR